MTGDIKGLLFSFIAAASFGLYSAYGKRGIMKCGGLTQTSISFLIGATCCILGSFQYHREICIETRGFFRENTGHAESGHLVQSGAADPDTDTCAEDGLTGRIAAGSGQLVSRVRIFRVLSGLFLNLVRVRHMERRAVAGEIGHPFRPPDTPILGIFLLSCNF